MEEIAERPGELRMNDYTGSLYADPSFLEGLARVLDIGGVFDDLDPVEDEDDGIASGSDWYAVGADLRRAVLGFAASNEGGRLDAHRSRS